MAKDDTASIHKLKQRPKTASERARAYRARQKAQPLDGAVQKLPAIIPTSGGHLPEVKSNNLLDLPAIIPATSSQHREDVPANIEGGAPPNVPNPLLGKGFPQTVTFAPVSSRPNGWAPSRLALSAAALALAGVGMTMNGWFARSLGSSDVAGYLFLAIGVAADVVALAVPSVAARHWQARQRGTAATAWAVWLMTFTFAITAGIGFASVNISDVTQTRAERVTPAVLAAQTALGDAMGARDRECRGGTGKFCREREAAVVDLRHGLDQAMASVASTADPQAEAAIRMVAWASRGTMTPTGNDFVMLRLALLSLLPQIGGILLMIGRRA